MERVLVVGVTGAGKTTTAEEIAALTDLVHVELDALFWGPDWQERTTEAFRASVVYALAENRWVACGNYHGRLRDLTWERADTIVWLDLPRWRSLSQLVTRTLGRILRREILWNGNRETLRNVFFDSESLLVWWWKVTRMEPRHTSERLAGLDANVVRLRSRRDVTRFLETLSPEQR